jgi:Zn-dependent protease with chaperone function
MENITVTPEFKKKATKAIFSIILFVITYLALFILAVGLTILCGYGAIMLVSFKAHFVTLMLGLGIAAVGVLTLFFLIKFIFTRNKTDLSNYLEVTEEDQPELFALIHDVVQEAGTQFPRKVYLSSEVNASVFYNSSFWSMFLPVRKNLHIGLGLMNSVTVDEFKGIIAHEFGHFSQRSMKVGSYVYNVNYIIHNMLYDNEGYNNFVSKLANLNGWLSFPLLGSIKIVQAIQWVLQKVYHVVNLNYRALSREMEFHADEVAARIAGPHTIETSLVRLSLADAALNDVFSFYSSKIENNIRPKSLFPQHLLVMHYRANYYGFPLENGLPQITPESSNRFSRSKLEFDNTWATHPSNEDRIARVKSLGLDAKRKNNNPAMSLLQNRETTEERIISLLYSHITWTGLVSTHDAEDFKTEFIEQQQKELLPEKFNKYYDEISIPELDIEGLKQNTVLSTETSASELFKMSKVNQIYEQIGLEQDIATLNEIAQGNYKVKDFVYAGRRYSAEEAPELLKYLGETLEQVKTNVTNNHKLIFAYYLKLAQSCNKEHQYLSLYKNCHNYYKDYDQKFEVLDKMFKLTSFTAQATPHDKITDNFVKVYRHEVILKKDILQFIEEPANAPYITAEIKESLSKYAEAQYRYFDGKNYNDEALGSMYQAIHLYNNLLNYLSFCHKKAFLTLQAELEPQPTYIL